MFHFNWQAQSLKLFKHIFAWKQQAHVILCAGSQTLRGILGILVSFCIFKKQYKRLPSIHRWLRCLFMARICRWYSASPVCVKVTEVELGDRFSFRLWAEMTSVWKGKPAACDRSVTVWWRSVWQLNRSFARQIKEEWHTLQPSEQHYNIKTQ